MRPTLGVIGAGRVGHALARLLAAQGWRIVTVHSRTASHAHALADVVGAETAPGGAAVLARADLVLLTVPDDAIESVAEALTLAALPGQTVVHTSGARGAEALAPLEQRGVRVGSLHPAYPFTGNVPPTLSGTHFAVEAGDAELRDWLLDIVNSLGGVPLVIPGGGKAQYHAALAIASNYTVTLHAESERLLLALGIPRAAADGALNALLAGTVVNLQTVDIPNALTGPLSRGDAGTLRLHLRVLDETDPELAALYRLLARRTLPMLRARGVATDAIEHLLEEESAHAPDRS